MANTATLTFEGDTAGLEKSLDRAGGATEKMGERAASATRDLDEHAGGLSRVGEAADNSERNIIGVHDVIDGTATIMKGPGKQGIVAYIQGWADLAGGAAPLLLSLAELKLKTIAQTIAEKAAAIGSKAWAAAQWLMNTALLASPITWIIVGIVALIAIIVLIATKTNWFQKAWSAAWGWVKSAASSAWNFIKQIPGWIGTAFARVTNFIVAPYRAAFNGIARAWNSTVGRLSFTFPDWIPGLGGKGFSVPNLPTFHAGGVVPGVVGTNVVAMLQAGETVSSNASTGGAGRVTIGSDGSRLGDALVDLIAAAVRKRGGAPGQLGLKIAA
jgi:phage-related protein